MIVSKKYLTDNFNYFLHEERVNLTDLDEEAKKEAEKDFTKFVFKRATSMEHAKMLDCISNNADEGVIGQRTSIFILSILLVCIKNIDNEDEIYPTYSKNSLYGVRLLCDEFINRFGVENLRELAIYSYTRCMMTEEEKKN